MIAGLKRLLGASRIATRPELETFIDRHAAMITNRSVIGYCHVKTRMPLHELTREAPFAEAFNKARSESYAAIAADLVMMTEGLLRTWTEADLTEGLVALYRDLLARQPVPSHRPAGWSDEIEDLRARLAFARQGPRQRVADIAERSAARVYATMPIHESLRAQDEPAIKANVQFLIVGLYREFERRLDCAALASALAA